MPKDWAKYKRDQRARDRAAGLVRLDVSLSPSAQANLKAVCSAKGATPSEAIADCLALWVEIRDKRAEALSKLARRDGETLP